MLTLSFWLLETMLQWLSWMQIFALIVGSFLQLIPRSGLNRIEYEHITGVRYIMCSQGVIVIFPLAWRAETTKDIFHCIFTYFEYCLIWSIFILFGLKYFKISPLIYFLTSKLFGSMLWNFQIYEDLKKNLSWLFSVNYTVVREYRVHVTYLFSEMCQGLCMINFCNCRGD